MEIKLKQSILKNGKRFFEGDKIDVSDEVAKRWVKKGLASKVARKKVKDNFETKELKVEFIDVKDNEANKD